MYSCRVLMDHGQMYVQAWLVRDTPFENRERVFPAYIH